MSDNKRGGYDYSECSFEIRLTKRKFLHSVLLYVYFAKDKLVICKQPYQRKPDKIINLNTRYTIKWISNSKKHDQPFNEKTIGFSLLNEKEESVAQFYGENIIMVCLMEFLAKQIFQADFLNEYEILQKIGKGKYAKVYKVKRKDTGEFYAVKFLHKKKMQDIDDSDLALDNELNILRSIDHPNCLKLVACFQDSNGYYILTELLDESKSLSQEISKYKNPSFSNKMVKHILSSLLKGLEYVHSKGIMHRDLKPQNIMFTQCQAGAISQIKLIDFGLAQIMSQPKYIYVHVGTPGFVAPEILANESEDHRYDEKCDLFSIGVIFHILQNSIHQIFQIKNININRLTGKTVFPGNKFSQVLEKNKQCQVQLTGGKYEQNYVNYYMLFNLNSIFEMILLQTQNFQQQISVEALDLLGKLLQKDPKKRVSAKDALQHPFFSEKGTEIDKMATCIETGKNLQMKKLKEEIGLLKIPNRPIQTSSSLQEYDPSYGVSQNLVKGSIFSQMNSLKSIRDINNINEGNVQIEALYKFTKDLLQLLEDIEEKKEYLHTNVYEDSDSPMKIQNGHTFTQSPLSVKEGNQKQKITQEIKTMKDAIFINPVEVPELTEEEEDENIPPENNNIQINDQYKQNIREIKKNLFINTKINVNENQSPSQKNTEFLTQQDNSNKNSHAPTLNNEEDSQFTKQIDLNKIGRKIQYPPKNMILNEMPSPISPPANFKIRPKLLLHIQKDQGSSTDDNLNSPNGQNQSRLSKEVVQLLDHFPKDMFSCYLNHDKLEIEKGMSTRVYKLGLFLLFGKDVFNSQPKIEEIQQKLNEVQEKKQIAQWFINMLRQMTSEKENDRPTIKQLNKIIQQNYKQQK